MWHRVTSGPMYLGRVIGTVVASRVVEGLGGQKFLLVQPLDEARVAVGDPHVAVDTVRAGYGDIVYCEQAREAALALDPWFVPVDHAILGIVDAIDVLATSATDPDPFLAGSA